MPHQPWYKFGRWQDKKHRRRQEQEEKDYAREAANNANQHLEMTQGKQGELPSLPWPSNPPTTETNLIHPITTNNKKDIIITTYDTKIKTQLSKRLYSQNSECQAHPY